MCFLVLANRGQKEIESPRQFLEHFGFLPDIDINNDIDRFLTLF